MLLYFPASWFVTPAEGQPTKLRGQQLLFLGCFYALLLGGFYYSWSLGMVLLFYLGTLNLLALMFVFEDMANPLLSGLVLVFEPAVYLATTLYGIFLPIFGVEYLLPWVLMVTAYWFIDFAVTTDLDENERKPRLSAETSNFANSFRNWSGWRRFFNGWLGHKLPGRLADISASDYNRERPVIYAVYPHGVATLGTIATFGIHGGGTQVPCKIAATPSVLSIPILGALLQAGGVFRCTKERMRTTIDDGFSIVVVPDGVPGILLAGRGNLDELDITGDRIGFLSLAYEKGTPVVPVYMENEHRQAWRLSGDTVRRFSPRLGEWIDWLQAMCVKRFRFSLFMPVGLFGGHQPRGPVLPHLGSAVRPTNYETREAFCKAFFTELVHLINEQTEDKAGTRIGSNLTKMSASFGGSQAGRKKKD